MRVRAFGVLALVVVATGATCDEPVAPDTCVEGRTMTIGTDVTGAVAGGDCDLPDGDGRVGDSYAFSVQTQSVIRFDVTGGTETGIRIRDNSKTGEQDVALHDNGLSSYQSFVVLKPGSYTLDISADENDASGNYTIKTSLLAPPQEPAGCIQPPNQWRFAAVGVTISGLITTNDCAGSGAGRVDNYNVKMIQGGFRRVTVTVSAGAAVEIRLMDSPAFVTTPMARNTAGDILVSFTPTSSDYYNIAIISTPGANPTSYTIKFE